MIASLEVMEVHTKEILQSVVSELSEITNTVDTTF